MHLPVGTLLQGGRYEIIRYISSGGFGCTYEARDTKFKSRVKSVAIKEFFVKDFCNRNVSDDTVVVATQNSMELINRLRTKFCEEADALFELEHPNIVRVTDTFEENGTAYYVMDYIEGCTLASLVEQKGCLSEDEALHYIRQVADALKYVHSHKRSHFDVKPQNIMVDSNGRAVLIDFGVSKQYDEANGVNTSTLVGYTPGYAPSELTYNDIAGFSPTTDIYSLGATLFNLVTGTVPPNASKVNEDGLPVPVGVSEQVFNAIKAAMQPRRKDRPQTIDGFLAILGDNAPAGVPEKNNKSWIVLFILLLICGFGAGVWFGNGGIEGKETPVEVTDKTETGAQKSLVATDVVPATDSEGANNPQQDKVSEVHQVNEDLNDKGNNVIFKDRHKFTVKGVDFTMIAVAGGKFRMGSEYVYDNEKPVHDVTVSDYYIGETEVTQALWEAVMGTTIRDQAKKGTSSADLKGIGYNYPMYYISYDDCVAFVKKLNEKMKAAGQLPAGREFRLPTEAEWEFAARGGNSSQGYRYSGSNTFSSVAWYGDNSNSTTHPVKQKQANELGLYDMSGNVLEWCYDSFSDYPTLPQTNPKVDKGSGSGRVLRGGSWGSDALSCRVAYRNSCSPDFRFNFIGLRLAL